MKLLCILKSSVLLAAAFFLALSAAAAPQYGQVEFANSGAPKAQADFLAGLALLHDFEYESAAAAFRRAEAADPNFAMAYWGEAMTFNHPVWMQQDLKSARAALRGLPHRLRCAAPRRRPTAKRPISTQLKFSMAKARRKIATSVTKPQWPSCTHAIRTTSTPPHSMHCPFSVPHTPVATSRPTCVPQPCSRKHGSVIETILACCITSFTATMTRRTPPWGCAPRASTPRLRPTPVTPST